MRTLPVVAAVPNYNMGEQLCELLPSLLEGGYREIFVLDDASTDDSREITHQIHSDIKFVTDGENRGAGGNRNRILEVLRRNANIHFIDADCTLNNERTAEVIAETLPKHPFGIIGGLTYETNGFQNVYNYGPRQSLYADLGAFVQARVAAALPDRIDLAKKIIRQYPRLLADWPNPLAVPKHRSVFWAAEANLVVDSQTFRRSGGFDNNLREHGIKDIAIRMHKAGLPRYFDPSFAVTHHAVKVRGYNRAAKQLEAELAIVKKHGFRDWLQPSGNV